MPPPIMLWVEASFCPISLCGRDDRGLDCRDTCVLLQCKTKRWNTTKHTITKLLLWQLSWSAGILCLKVILAETCALSLRHKQPQTQCCPLATFLLPFFPLPHIEKKYKRHPNTQTHPTTKVLDKMQLMQLSLSREEGLPQLLELL